MIALDTNVFIYWLERNPEFYAKSAELIAQVHSGAQPACCSALTLSELYNGDGVPIEAITRLPNLLMVPVTPGLAELAGRLRHQHNLKVIDAVHLATALQAGADTFITNDILLTKVKIAGLTIKRI